MNNTIYKLKLKNNKILIGTFCSNENGVFEMKEAFFEGEESVKYGIKIKEEDILKKEEIEEMDKKEEESKEIEEIEKIKENKESKEIQKNTQQHTHQTTKQKHFKKMDQFQLNEHLFGITNNFDENAYTIPLDKESDFYKKNVSEAKRIEKEIMSLKHNKIEREENDEVRYSMVIGKKMRGRRRRKEKQEKSKERVESKESLNNTALSIEQQSKKEIKETNNPPVHSTSEQSKKEEMNIYHPPPFNPNYNTPFPHKMHTKHEKQNTLKSTHCEKHLKNIKLESEEKRNTKGELKIECLNKEERMKIIFECKEEENEEEYFKRSFQKERETKSVLQKSASQKSALQKSVLQKNVLQTNTPFKHSTPQKVPQNTPQNTQKKTLLKGVTFTTNVKKNILEYIESIKKEFKDSFEIKRWG